MSKKNDALYSEILNRINPSVEEVAKIEKNLLPFLKKIQEKINKQKIKVQIFVGGSFAKKTLIKKDIYDIDIFLRFDKKYIKENIAKITKKLLKGSKKLSELKGSRNYFRVAVDNSLVFEIVPVIEVDKPSKAINITDLSYSHVNYIKKKINNQKILDDIKIAKAFCYANKCYGAESYIRGFSGYSLELLIYYYKSFEKFLKELSKIKKKLVIDIEKKYPNSRRVLLDMNGAKIQSPIILVDPTYKQRNVLAALSDETFEIFQKAAKNFLKKPSIKSFEKEKTDLKQIIEDAKNKKQEFVLIEAKTPKQEGDIAATKLLKFYNALTKDIEKYFLIKKNGFNYGGKKAARYFYVVESKKEIISKGPLAKQDKNIKKFQKAHKNTFKKLGRIYARDKINFSLKQFLGKYSKDNKRKIKDMYIDSFKIV